MKDRESGSNLSPLLSLHSTSPYFTSSPPPFLLSTLFSSPPPLLLILSHFLFHSRLLPFPPPLSSHTPLSFSSPLLSPPLLSSPLPSSPLPSYAVPVIFISIAFKYLSVFSWCDLISDSLGCLISVSTFPLRGLNTEIMSNRWIKIDDLVNLGYVMKW